MHVEPRGPKTCRRWVINHQRRYWTGKTWQKNCRSPLLYPHSAAAFAEFPRLEQDLAARARITCFSIPLEIHVPSPWPFNMDEMRRFLMWQLKYSFLGMEGAPDDAERACVVLNWSKCKVRQHGKGKPG